MGNGISIYVFLAIARESEKVISLMVMESDEDCRMKNKMKKIGIITFHWATNYGAVLQAYALRTYIERCGYNAEIINYVPWRQDLIRRVLWLKTRSVDKIRKEQNIQLFRKKNLKCSKRYVSNKSLKKCSSVYKAIICGSDQIWNESFTLGGEGQVTLSYFLNFASEKTKRIAYAASFGSTDLSDEYINVTKNEIGKFMSVSVRENTAIELVHRLGREAIVVCDPTLLLRKDDYLSLIPEEDKKAPNVFGYVLHDSEECKKIVAIVKRIFGDELGDVTEDYGVEEWLWRINNSEMVVTNSFHGVMLSLILNKSFLVTPTDNHGMNDRIETVLSLVDLEDRILKNCSEHELQEICRKEIEWEKVNKKLDERRALSQKFLYDALTQV